MRRLAVVIAIVVVLTGVLAYPRGASTATAQDTMADHPVVGAWKWVNEPPGGGETFISYGIFHADGTYVEVNIDNLTSIGAWQPTGERTADASFFFADLDPDPNVTALGEGRQSVEVDESGNTITSVISFRILDPDGTVVFSDEDVTSRGTRLDVSPMAPLATPAAATPEV